MQTFAGAEKGLNCSLLVSPLKREKRFSQLNHLDISDTLRFNEFVQTEKTLTSVAHLTGNHNTASPDFVPIEEALTLVAHLTGNHASASPDSIPVEENLTLAAHLTGNRTTASPDSIPIEENLTSVAHLAGNRTTASPDFVPIEEALTSVAHLTGNHASASPDFVPIEEALTSVAHLTGNHASASPDFIPVEEDLNSVAHLTNNPIPVRSNSTGTSANENRNQFAQLRGKFTSTKRSLSQFVYSTDVTSSGVISATVTPSIIADSSAILCTNQTCKRFREQSVAIKLRFLLRPSPLSSAFANCQANLENAHPVFLNGTPLSEEQRQVSINLQHPASRGCSNNALLNCQSLLSDPDLVWKTEEHWPYGSVPLSLLTVRDTQRQDECFVFCTERSYEKLTLYFAWFIFFKLLKVVIWILKFITFLLAKVKFKLNRSLFELTRSSEKIPLNLMSELFVNALNRFTVRLDRPECRILINDGGSKVIRIPNRERHQHRTKDYLRHHAILGPSNLKSPTVNRERIVTEDDRFSNKNCIALLTSELLIQTFFTFGSSERLNTFTYGRRC